MSVVIEIPGRCPICAADVVFRAESASPVPPEWRRNLFRNALLCPGCGSIPRERALAHLLFHIRPDWRHLDIHESSPVLRGLVPRLLRECPGYVITQFSADLPAGARHPTEGWRNEDLAAQTFPDASLDVVITLDVFEHLFHPGRAAREIARTLRPGGLCIMCVPVVQPYGQTRRRAALVDGQVQHLDEPQYHGNPVGDGRALVTVDWSLGIGAYLTAQSGLPFAAHLINDLSLGIADPWNVVLTAVKSPLADLGE